jgi:hypothetical protein
MGKTVEERGTLIFLKPHEVSDFPFERCGLRPGEIFQGWTLALIE